MPPKVQVPETQGPAEINVVVDRDAHAITLTRSFAAPREHVFEACTRPEHVACWWDPSGAQLTECMIDLRPGGAFRFVNHGSSHVPPFSGIYREIAPPERLIF